MCRKYLPGGVVEHDRLPWQVAILDLEQLDVFLAACYDRGGEQWVELHGARVKIQELACQYLNLLELDHVLEPVHDDGVAHLMILAAEAEVLGLVAAAQRDGMHQLHWRLESQHALAVCVCCIEVHQRPQSDLIVPGLFFEAPAHREGVVAASSSALDEQLVDVIGLPLVEESLLLQGRIES